MRKLFFEYCWHENNELKEITYNELLHDKEHYKWSKHLLINVNITIHTNGIIEMFYEVPKIVNTYFNKEVNSFLDEYGKILSKKDIENIIKNKRGLYYKIIKKPIYTNLFQVPFKMWYQYLFKKWNRYIEVFKSIRGCMSYFITTEKKKEHVLYKDWKTITPLNK